MYNSLISFSTNQNMFINENRPTFEKLGPKKDELFFSLLNCSLLLDLI